MVKTDYYQYLPGQDYTPSALRSVRHPSGWTHYQYQTLKTVVSGHSQNDSQCRLAL
jgi:hypothetical protein